MVLPSEKMSFLALILNNLKLKSEAKKNIFDCLTNYESWTCDLLNQKLAKRFNYTVSRSEWSEWERESEKTLRICQSENIRIVYLNLSEYPFGLRQIAKPPFLFYCKGHLPPNYADCLALVGTRNPTSYGERATFEFALEAVSNGWHIVSGGARGIDSIAHDGALKLLGATTVVMGSGFLHLYPREQVQQMDRILHCGGGWISEYAPWIKARQYHFPQRNRLVAGLVRAVIVIEAPSKSGALITAYSGLNEGREIFVHQKGLTGANSQGCQQLYDQGASSIRHMGDLASEWNIPIRRVRSFPVDWEEPILLRSNGGAKKNASIEKCEHLIRYRDYWYELEPYD